MYFDGLVKSIEERRSALLKEAEEASQKDLKQIWADKEFHEVTISHVTAVFKLVDKAHKCTSDSEIVLTALQSISQLKGIKEKKWDSRDFVRMVCSAPSFKKNELSMDSFGNVIRVSSPSKEMKISAPSQAPYLHQSFIITVGCSPIKSLVDGRSGEDISLQMGVMFPELEVVVHYGKAKKEYRSDRIAIKKYGRKQKGVQSHSHMKSVSQATGGKRKAREHVPSHPLTTVAASTSSDSVTETTYHVSIQFVCGGTHTVIFRYGNGEMIHTFTVKGQLQNGCRVRKGPDWTEHQATAKVASTLIADVLPFTTSYGYEATSSDDDDYYGPERMKKCGGPVHTNDGIGIVNNNYAIDDERMMVTVLLDNGQRLDYKWGKDEEYEIELCK